MKRLKGGAGKFSDDEDDLGAPLLNSSIHDDDESIDTPESIELTNFSNRRRKRTDSPTETEHFVWHILEPHHTLAGIALQYRVTIEALMRQNKLRSALDLHILSRVKIPARAHGALLHNPEDFRSEDVGTTTHTTAIPQARSELEIRTENESVDGTTLVTLEEQEAEKVVRPSPATFLNSFDNQMQSAIEAMDKTLQKQSKIDEETVYIRSARNDANWEIKIQDWRVAVLALAVVLLVSFSTVYLFKFVNAPPPHN